MTPYDTCVAKLRENMTEGQMHVCLRDIGALAGGFRAGRAISPHELNLLETLAVSLAKDKEDAARKWKEAVEYGKGRPVKEEVKTFGHFGFDDRVDVTNPRKKQSTEPAPLVDAQWVEPDDIPAPAVDWRPGDMIRYLKAMFEPDECVGIVTSVFEDDGKFRPGNKGVYDLTCGFLCEKLSQIGDVDTIIENAITTPNPLAGVWIRINPLDGKGVKDVNVTAFRHTLIEADDQDLGKQLALIRELELPCSAIVHSGGKSIHALVRVDAPDLPTYKARVDRLYKVCADSGLKVDQANRNPSRLSRLPGVHRGARPQYLIDGKCGRASWDEWEQHVEEVQDDLPPFVSLSDVFFNPPPLRPVFIEGILREGHKLRLTGPSKAGKSTGLAELCIAVAEGHTGQNIDWFGLKCQQGGILYINFEQDEAECYDRFIKIYKAHGWTPTATGCISVWNLRGKTRPLNKLAPLLIRRARQQRFKAIIFDPLYKTNWADENNAGDMALFCNELDRISNELGVAVVDSHHHSKGAQGQKKSIDRGSGSGVFGRDPDAILDLIELDIDSARQAEVNKQFWHPAVKEIAAANRLDLDSKITGDAWRDVNGFALEFATAFPEHAAACSEALQGAMEHARRLSGWRMEATLRSFATPTPQRLWFDFPIHYADQWGLLEDAKAAGEEPPWAEQQRVKEEARKAKAAVALEAFHEALDAAGGPGKATVKRMCQLMGVSDDTVKRLVHKAGYGRQQGVILAKDGQDREESEGDE